MEKVIILVDEKELHEFAVNVWQTDEFRRLSQTYGNVIQHTVSRFSLAPRIIADMTNKDLETPHFYSWFNILMNRFYANPYIHDLYILHEMMHIVSMPYMPNMSFETFCQKMNNTELNTSLATEVLIYLDNPELRPLTFPHRIYVDDLLNRSDFLDHYKNDREGAINFLREVRREIMYGSGNKDLDPIEASINLYAAQNTQWQMVWKLRYNEVENTLWHFYRITNKNNRKLAINGLLDWLNSVSTNEYTIPYIREAEMFSAIYWNNKKHYNDMITNMPKRTGF
jgi:hypothetical protein